MTEHSGKFLSEIVGVARHYQRSIRVDADYGREDALDGYVCHPTASALVESMSRQIAESNQRAFTWTGPYGGGKSSLAVTLASAVCPDKKLRAKARSLLQVNDHPLFDKAFPVRRGWLVVPVVGKRAGVTQEIHKALRTARRLPPDARKPAAASLISDLCSAAREENLEGTLLIIDELGKFLEASALGYGDDIYFFQELAEAARMDGRVVVVGVLHQSFGQYAARLGVDTREDWAKIQGRYSDVPLVAAGNEVVGLISRAIEARERPSWVLGVAQSVAEAIRSRRPSVSSDIEESLAACWPLHPTMAALLGSASKRQFGQNERSVFGFLSSAEPHGFRSFLETTRVEEAAWYRPDHFFDYLQSNLEPAILASPDGHRWAQAVDAVNRAEAKSGDALVLSLIKCVAVIDLFKNGSGLAAEPVVLRAVFAGTAPDRVDAALADLARWRVALFKKHAGAWSIFEGSDFDIESAVAQARATASGTDFKLLSKLADPYPVIAKRHYHETGTFRWLNVALCSLDEICREAEAFKPSKGEFGLFLLALPGRGTTEESARRRCAECSRMNPWPVVVGLPRNHARIEELGANLLALQTVQTRPELEGDSVGRREVQARTATVRSELEEQLSAALVNAQWFAGDMEIESGGKLARIASSLADAVYPDAPGIWSELVNREGLSSNSVKARRDLLHAMIDRENEPHLGISGFPAERGLYETLLVRAGLHAKEDDGHWRFLPPNQEIGASFKPLWEATRKLFSDPSVRVGADEIGRLWTAPPFGLRSGVVPVVFFAFVMAYKGNIALYKDGIFVPRVTDADVDEYLQNYARFSLRWVTIDEQKLKILDGISEILHSVGAKSVARDPLEAARGLVALAYELPAWTQKTATLTPLTRSIRDTLIKASDPHKVLFVDLVALLSTTEADEYVEALRVPISELASAYEAMLRRVEATMLEALDAETEDHEGLRRRAEAVAGVTGDLRQDAFATRLANHDGSRESVEGLLSLAANKPPRDWSDRDINSALLELTRLSLRLRQAEALVSVRGRKPNSEAFAVVVGAGPHTKTISRQFEVPERHIGTVESLAKELADGLLSKGLKTEVLLAALGHACLRLAADVDKRGCDG
jgi:hypothetical protein